MSLPPDDDTWQSVLGELNDALDSLQLRDGPERQSLVEGVKEAMQSIFEVGAEVIVSATVEQAPAAGPSVVVLDGGKDASAKAGDTQQTTAKPKVRFKVVSETETATDEESTTDSPLGASADIHVYRADPRAAQTSVEASSVPLGTIVTQSDNGAPLWQTIYQGQDAHSYRVFCEQGTLEIVAGDLPAEIIRPHQSIDLQAKRIRVRSFTHDEARGVYCKITG